MEDAGTRDFQPGGVGVAMVREDLDDIPRADLPEGFTIDRYVPGDEAHWVRIHELADLLNDITLDTFRESFGADLEAMRSRGFFLRTDQGETIGTATAWYDLDFYGKNYGRIHWVAILPEYQGRGLAKPLMSVVLDRLKEDHARCYLTTNAQRVPAIHLYLKYGFKPFFRSAECEKEWDWVRGKLDHPLLDTPIREHGARG